MTLVDEAFAGTLADSRMPAFLLDAGNQRYKEFFNAYAQSAHGKHQAHQPLRYEAAFGCYDRNQMLYDLGTDVHPLGHMPATERTFVTLVGQGYDFSPNDLHVGRLAALVHDIGENTHPQLLEIVGAVVGDIPQGRKTAEHRATEMRIWDYLIDLYYGDQLPGPQRARMRDLVTHHEDSGRFGLHSQFEAAHDTNTMRVGLRAGRIALDLLVQGQTGSDRFACLSEMGRVVTRDALPRMEEHARSFALPDHMLEETAPLYQRIHSEL